jgi:hypothetical protein
LEVNDAVVVLWGRGSGKPWAAVVTDLGEDSVTVQFDSDRSIATVPVHKVSPMPLAQGLPAWMGNGSRVEAVDPLAKGRAVWYSATLLEARQGPITSPDDGLRLWVRYQPSKMCQWVKRKHVRGVGTAAKEPDAATAQPRPRKPPNVPIAVKRISTRAVIPGGELWLLLGASADKRLSQSTFEVSFGSHVSPAELIAPSLLSCLVPSTLPAGVSPLSVAAQLPGDCSSLDIACPFTIEVLLGAAQQA